MSTATFFEDSARATIEQAIARAEEKTSAELVVAIRRTSRRHLAGALIIGALFSFATLAAMLFLPIEFPLWSILVDVVLAFALGTAAGRAIPPLARLATPARELVTAAETAAAATFLARGGHRCKGRNGVLFYLSALERRVVVIADIAIDGAAAERARDGAQSAFDRGDVAGFAKVLEDLGERLSSAHPRAHDDVDELPNAVCVE
jgi:putative membrane protein